MRQVEVDDRVTVAIIRVDVAHTFANGLIVKTAVDGDPDEALEAVGLPPDSR